ncbi:hypothetical protein [Bacillus subtilis]|uniref:hypothetical protein n=1 Tax=Bacillus subtilis TaxID=1423 RepID=UPI0021DAC55D|nr:hypothetical protein [Bacillus subtilis]
MSKNKKNQEEKEVFEKTFGDLLSEDRNKEVLISNPEDTLDEALFGAEENKPLTDEEREAAAGEYIPPSIGDEQWEQFSSRTPLPPINREEEARAVSIGLQEIRKMKEYMLYIHRHMTNEFMRIYATYPLLFSKNFDESFEKAHKEIVAVMEDIEHLIAGDIDQVEAVKTDYKLYQIFSEKRLSLLYDLLEHYNKKK